MKARTSKQKRTTDAQLLAYCAVAGAALAAAQPAAAAVVYSGTKNISVGTDNSTVGIDLNGDSATDFNFFNINNFDPLAYMTTSYTAVNGMFAKNANLQNFVAYRKVSLGAVSPARSYGGPIASYFGGYKLQPGQALPSANLGWTNFAGNVWDDFGPGAPRRIDIPNLNLQTLGALLNGFYLERYESCWGPSSMNCNIYTNQSIGEFDNTTGYIGVQFQIAENTHYGWVRYTGLDNITLEMLGKKDVQRREIAGPEFIVNGKFTGTVVDWAYEDEPNKPLFIGETPCVDADADGYGANCTLGLDCDDGNPAVHDNCTCIDADADGYGEGPGCLAADCNDNDSSINADCPTCTVEFVPQKISKFLSTVSQFSLVLIRGDDGAQFDRDTAIDWGTPAIDTMIKIPVGKKRILALVLVSGTTMEEGETYSVRVGACAGELAVR